MCKLSSSIPSDTRVSQKTGAFEPWDFTGSFPESKGLVLMAVLYSLVFHISRPRTTCLAWIASAEIKRPSHRSHNPKAKAPNPNPKP